MASPLNTFKTFTKTVTNINEIAYTCPDGITAIVLLAQAANVTTEAQSISFYYYDANTTTSTELVNNFAISQNDASSLLSGKLVVETGNSLRAISSSADSFKLTLSILETLNA